MLTLVGTAVVVLDALAAGASLTVQLALGALVGIAAAIVMGVPMWRQDEGFTPAYIAASVLRKSRPDEVSFVDANVVHYLAGAMAGVLYAFVFLTSDMLFPDLPLFGVDAIPHLVATLFVMVWIYLLFAHFVLPRAGRSIYEERATAVRGQWLRSSLVFGVTMFVLAPAVFAGVA
ncbi:hypothetical protein ACFQJC_01670 [Haloferax namakaokahaiae]|uniref:Uncharacterized protein n=1 Tax=Haloferax namakaokahaiae TaxID=1748331 RepID=A0ABD5ZAZ9_9EURY